MTHLIPLLMKVTAKDITKKFLLEIRKLHVLLTKIISDQYAKIIGKKIIFLL